MKSIDQDEQQEFKHLADRRNDGYMMSGIGQVEQRRSVHGWRKTGNTGGRGTRSDPWPSAITIETRK